MAKGKFVPWSEAKKWYCLNDVTRIQYSIEIILGMMLIHHLNGKRILATYWSKDLMAMHVKAIQGSHWF